MSGESEREPALQEVVGESPVFLGVLQQAASATKSDSVVLITGEAGTGKELIARAIHRTGRRHTQSFVKVDCSKLAPAQLEAALFALDRGRIEAARQGTLLLSHVERVTRELQPRLLSALEQKDLKRSEGARVTIEARFIITFSDAKQSNSWLREKLSPDFNLSVINVPALRDRQADIPLLASHFVRKWSRLMNKPIHIISPANMNLLTSYSWPANIRELESVIERAVRSSNNGDLRLDLPDSET